MNDFAVLIAQHLELDMPRMLQDPLCVNVGVPEGLLRLAARGLVRGQQLSLVADNPHSPPAAAGHGFQDQGMPDPRGFLGELLFSFNDAVAPRYRRQPGSFHLSPRADLLAHHLDDFRCRTDKGNLQRLENLRVIITLVLKSVARMIEYG